MFSLKLSARVLAGASVSVAIAFSALAQPAPLFEPEVGQRGKDVVWVPTNQKLVDKMLDMAKVTPTDFVMDLGSGDGRTVITAAKRGATALGIEYNPDMVELARKNADGAGVSARANFEKADLFETDFSKANVITMFLLKSINMKLRPKLLDMKPGTRIASNTFDLGDWTADETSSIAPSCRSPSYIGRIARRLMRAIYGEDCPRAIYGEDCTSYCTAYFWIVPAKVEGEWQTPQGKLTLEQKFQIVSGRLVNGNVITPVTEGKLTGNRIAFTAGGTRYTGTVDGAVIAGKANTGGKEVDWTAKK